MMPNEEWVALMEKVLRTMGEVSPTYIQSATFRVTQPDFVAKVDQDPLLPNDGRPKIYILTVTTSA